MEERTGMSVGRRRGEGELAGCLMIGLRMGIREGVGSRDKDGLFVLEVIRTQVALGSLFSRCKRLAGREGGVWLCER